MRPGAGMLLAAALFAAVTPAAARPPKHLPRPGARDDVSGIQLARLTVGGNTVPIVVVAERSAIRVAWYAAGAGAWKSTLVREHGLYGPTDTPIGSPARLDRIPERVREWGWSDTIGVAAIGPKVFVVYKRVLNYENPNAVAVALWVDRLTWNAATEELTLDTAQPWTVPVTSSGFQVWAGEAAGRLVVVTQGRVGSSLRLLAFSAAPTADLSAAASWSSADLGAGGWDFDAVTQAGKLYAVFREAPLPAHVTFRPGVAGTQTLTLPSDGSAYDAPLTIAAFDVATSVPDPPLAAPACEHPQLQSITPLSLTCDRITDGRFIVEGADSRSPCSSCHPGNHSLARRRLAAREGAVPVVASMGTTSRTRSEPCVECHGTMTVRPDLARVTKYLLRAGPSRWIEDALFDFSAVLEPRSAAEPPSTVDPDHARGLTTFQYVVDEGPGPILRFGMLRRWHPVYLVGNGPAAARGQVIPLLHHRPENEAVVVTWYALTDQGGRADESGPMLLDVNHAQIPAEPAPPENGEFTPFAREEYADLASERRLVIKGMMFTVDNTIGGLLARDRGTPGLGFYAYSDLGDGGARVIFQESSVPAPAAVESGKLLSSEAVTGPGGTGAHWVDLPDAPQLQLSKLKAYPTGADVTAALASSADASLDRMCGLLLATGQECVITEQLAADLIEPFLAPPSPVELHGEEVTLRMNPGAPFADEPVIFTASPESPVATYRWKFGDAQVVSTTASHAWTFQPASAPTEPHTYDVAVEVEGVGSANGYITVAPTPWELLWEAHGPVEVGDGAFKALVFDADVSFSKYRVSYRYGEGSGPDRPRARVSITTLPEYAFLYRFARQPQGQGAVEHWLPVVYEAKDVQVLGDAGRFYAVNSILANVSVARAFTPGILTRERRTAGGPDLVGPSPAALAMKPIGMPGVVVGPVKVDGGLTVFGHGLIVIVSLVLSVLVALHRFSLVDRIEHALDAVGLASLAGGVPAAIALAAALVILEVEVPRVIAAEIEGQVQAELLLPERQAPIRELGSNAGEALAESLSVQAATAADGEEPAPSGHTRSLPDRWEMIYVYDGKARVLVRDASP